MYEHKEFWDQYYSKHNVTSEPSNFAFYVHDRILNDKDIVLEVGCGNGRDAFYFAKKGICVLAIDISSSAIEFCRNNLSNNKPLRFKNCSIEQLYPDYVDYFDVIYSRFVLHSMMLEEERKMLRTSFSLLKNGGKILLECRSVNDELINKGKVISPYERIYGHNGHYRRFIVKDDLVERLQANGFKIEFAVESKGFAVLGDDDPTVIRVCAVK